MGRLLRLWHRKIVRDNKEITIMPPVRWGNILYFILNCHTHKKYLVGSKPQVEGWLRLFPELKKFFLEAADVREWDSCTGITDYYQFLGKDFSYAELKVFVENFFLSSEAILSAKKENSEGIFYINVRRGDYYTQDHAPIYGFHVAEFVRHAVSKASLDGISGIKVISDDIPWCRENLSFLNSMRTPVDFLEKLSPEESFTALATAKNIILSNSTFCYWAAYIATFLHGGDVQIIAPDFGNRHEGYYRPGQYLPEWHRVQDFDYEMPFP